MSKHLHVHTYPRYTLYAEFLPDLPILNLSWEKYLVSLYPITSVKPLHHLLEILSTNSGFLSVIKHLPRETFTLPCPHHCKESEGRMVHSNYETNYFRVLPLSSVNTRKTFSMSIPLKSLSQGRT